MTRYKPNPEKNVNGAPLSIFDPFHKDYLPCEGRELILNAYWIKRLQDGDIVPAKEDEPLKNSTKEGDTKKSGKNQKKTSKKTSKKKPAAKPEKNEGNEESEKDEEDAGSENEKGEE